MFKVTVVETLGGVVISVVAMVPGLVGDIGVDVSWVVGSVVIKVDVGVVFVLQVETDSVFGAGGEDGRILIANVKVLW